MLSEVEASNGFGLQDDQSRIMERKTPRLVNYAILRLNETAGKGTPEVPATGRFSRVHRRLRRWDVLHRFDRRPQKTRRIAQHGERREVSAGQTPRKACLRPRVPLL